MFGLCRLSGRPGEHLVGLARTASGLTDEEIRVYRQIAKGNRPRPGSSHQVARVPSRADQSS